MSKPLALVFASLFLVTAALTPGTSQDRSAEFQIKFHDAEVQRKDMPAPVDSTVRINIASTGQMGLGLRIGEKYLCCGDGAIRTTFKVDGQIVFPGVGPNQGLPPGPNGKARAGSRCEFRNRDIVITQEVEVVPSKPNKPGEKRLLDTAMIRYTFHNVGTLTRKVGTRVRIDTMCGGNDGALFHAPTVFPTKILDGVELKDKTLPPFVKILEQANLANPGFTGTYTLKMPHGVIGPDRFICTTHGAAENGWDVTVQRSGGTDTDCALFWEPRDLPPGKKLVMAYGYGGGLATSMETEGRFTVALTGSFQPKKQFAITAYVDDPLPHQTLELSLMPGMSLTEGRLIQAVGAPSRDQASSLVMWKGAVDRPGDYVIQVRSNNGMSLARRVSITPADSPSGAGAGSP